MTAETGAALVNVPPNVAVTAVRGGLGVGVAIDAFKDCVRRLGRMTIDARCPSAGTVRVPRCNREKRMRIESGRNPRQGTMTHCTVRRKSCRDVVRIAGVHIFKPMTRDACDRSAVETVAGMTGDACNRLMRPADGELRAIMVEARTPGRCGFEMALLAHERESGAAMIDRHRSVVLFHMTLDARAGGPGESKVGVTGSTGGVAVLAVQRERGLLVVEHHRFFQTLPAFGRVTDRASLSEIAVRRRLRHQRNSCQDSPHDPGQDGPSGRRRLSARQSRLVILQDLQRLIDLR